MKLSLSIKIIVTVSVVLLCTGIAVYSFLRLNSVEQQQDFDLYSLVPNDAVAVFETDRIIETLESVEQMQCSKDGNRLQISELFTCLKNFLDTWIEESPHALSKEMNKVLISFHQPGTPQDKVLYCTLGVGDYERVEKFIGKYSASKFPVKSFDYRGEEIRIYTMRDGHFLSVYLTKKFMAVSFQKKLLEQVIDARHKKGSLKYAPSFPKFHEGGKQRNIEAMLYLRMHNVPMGTAPDSVQWTANVSDWMEFDLKFSEDIIYCSGISYEDDTLKSFTHTLRNLQDITDFAGDYLPASTVLYECRSILDDSLRFRLPSIWSNTKGVPQYISSRNKELKEILGTYTKGNVVSCFFRPSGMPDSTSCAVVIVPLHNAGKARNAFLSWLQVTPQEKGRPRAPLFNPAYDRYPSSQAYRKYLLPRNSLFVQLTGLTHSSFHSYACFYRDYLLLAADAFSLSAYIDAMEKKRVLADEPPYGFVTDALAHSYNLLLVADMEELQQLPAMYKRLIPTFFFTHIDFFRHFVFAFQFTNVDGAVCPNVALCYKGAI